MTKRRSIVLLIIELVSTTFSSPSSIYLGYQDSLGQYTFGYSAPESARSEIRSVDGLTRGSFSYIDGAGVIQSAQYEADNEGFRIAATNLPQAPKPVEDTPEVIAARMEHFRALEIAAQRAKEEGDERQEILVKARYSGHDRIVLRSNDSSILNKPAEILIENSTTIRGIGMADASMNKILLNSASFEELHQKIMLPNESPTEAEQGKLIKSENLIRQELMARNFQILHNNYQQFRKSGTTPAHTILINMDQITPHVTRVQIPSKIMNRIAPKMGNSDKNEQKIMNRIAPKMGNSDKNEQKIMNRIAPKMDNSGENELKITHRIAPKEVHSEQRILTRDTHFSTVRTNQLHGLIRDSVFAPVNIIPLKYPYSYNLGPHPFHYGTHSVI